MSSQEDISEIRQVFVTTMALISFSTITISILEPQQIYSLWDGLYFSVITLTSVGFGDITPQSFYGKAFTMLLSILGLGIFGAVVEIVGKWRERIFSPFTETNSANAVLSLVTLLTFGSLLFSILEGWSMHDSAYFSLVTATTVGFGDLTPKSQGGRIATMIYALLSLTPMAFVVGEVKRVLLSTAVGKRKDE